mgnify:CR=1 FL=1
MFVTAVVWERPHLHNSELEAKRDALQEEIAVTVELTQNAVAENARVAQDQDDYNKRYNALVERYDRLKAQYDEVSTAISDNKARYEADTTLRIYVLGVLLCVQSANFEMSRLK